MAWGSMLKGIAKGAIKKKVKKKGAEMAKNITNKKEKDDSSAIVVREKSTSLVGPLLGGDTDSTDSSSNTSKKSRSRSPLDRIDSSLKDIMKTLKKRRRLMLNKSRRMRVQADKDKKGKREGLLEKMKTTGKNMVKSAAAGAKGWWERLQKFLLMTMLGALVVAIKENWEKIKEKIDKVVKFVQDLWNFMSPVLIPLFKALKWITVQGFKLIGKLLGMGKDKKQIEKGTDEASNELENLKKETEGLTKQFKESEKNIKNISNTKEPNLDTKTELSESEVAEGVTNNKVDDRPLSVTNPEMKNNKGGRRNRKKYNVGGYVHEDGEVHEGEYVVKESIVKKVGVTNIENVVKSMMKTSNKDISKDNILNMMQTSTTNIKQNPLKVISIMERMSKQFAPMGEQLPDMINETIKESKLGTVSKKVTREMVEKMEKTLTVLKEQTEYEDPSASTVIIRVPTPSTQSVGGGGGGRTIAVPVGESGKATLNRYINALTQKALY